MNTYFNKDIFPQNDDQIRNYQINQPTEEQIKNYQTKYNQTIPQTTKIENILKMNKGKQVKIYMTFPYINEIKEFKGILEQIGMDFITLSEPSTGAWNLLPLIYLSYITFDENINYNNWFKNKNLL